MTRTERLAAATLGLAAVMIVALSLLVLVELDREQRLHQDVIAQLEAADRLDALRTDLTQLSHAVRIAALTASPESVEPVERLSSAVEERLREIAADESGVRLFAAYEPVARAARLVVLNARSVTQARAARGAAFADKAALEAQARADEAVASLDRTLDAQAGRINRRTLAQIRVGEALRHYVVLSIGASGVLLAVLFVLYRRAKARERRALLRIEHMAHYDAVTGLPNRMLLADRLDQEIARALRGNRGFALLMIDLDGFKAVNDTWGHATGDAVLAQAADRARQCMRASDTVGRLGGDEFLALLPETGADGALHVAQKLRDALAEPYPVQSIVARIGASVGIALYPEHAADAEALQRAADAALYEAKRGGRNRVVVAKAARAAAVS